MGPTDHMETPPGSPKPLQTPCLWSCSPLDPSSHPHPPPQGQLTRSPRWHLNLCRWPVVHLEANLSLWVCEKAQECEHLALPPGKQPGNCRHRDCLCCIDRRIWASEFSPRRNWVHGTGVSLKNVWKVSKSLPMWQCTSLPRSVCKDWREWLLL